MVEVSDGFCALVGRSRAEILGKTADGPVQPQPTRTAASSLTVPPPEGWERLPRKRGVRVLRIAGTFR